MISSKQCKFATIYQSLYLSNLLLVPVLSFILLVYFFYQSKTLSNFNKIHLIRSIQISVLAGLILGIAPVVYIFFSDQFDISVLLTIFYFVIMHVSFVLIGIVNLSRAMSKKLPLF